MTSTRIAILLDAALAHWYTRLANSPDPEWYDTRDREGIRADYAAFERAVPLIAEVLEEADTLTEHVRVDFDSHFCSTTSAAFARLSDTLAALEAAP